MANIESRQKCRNTSPFTPNTVVTGRVNSKRKVLDECGGSLKPSCYDSMSFRIISLDHKWRSSGNLSLILMGFLVSSAARKYELLDDWVVNGLPVGSGLEHRYRNGVHSLCDQKGAEYFEMTVHHPATKFPEPPVAKIEPIPNWVLKELSISSSSSSSSSTDEDDNVSLASETESAPPDREKPRSTLTAEGFRSLSVKGKHRYVRAYLMDEPRLEAEFGFHFQWVGNDILHYYINGEMSFEIRRAQLPKPFNGFASWIGDEPTRSGTRLKNQGQSFYDEKRNRLDVTKYRQLSELRKTAIPPDRLKILKRLCRAYPEEAQLRDRLIGVESCRN